MAIAVTNETFYAHADGTANKKFSIKRVIVEMTGDAVDATFTAADLGFVELIDVSNAFDFATSAIFVGVVGPLGEWASFFDPTVPGTVAQLGGTTTLYFTVMGYGPLS